MFKELNEKLSNCKESVRLEKSLRKQLESLEKKLSRSKEELEALNQRVEKEYKDVKNLTKPSFTNAFHSLLGSKDKKMDKEQREYLEAKELQEKCERSISDYEFDVTALRDRIRELRPIVFEYKDIMDQKYKKLIEVEGEDKERILYLENRIKEIKEEKVQLNEALKETDNCKPILDEAKKHLTWAQNLGHVDMATRGKGSMIASLAKQAKMKDAKKCIEELNWAMKKLNEELDDVNLRIYTEEIDVDTFSSVMDIFADNFYTDAAMQDKIRRSLSNITYLRNKVYDISDEVRQRENDMLTELEANEIELDSIIELA